MKLYPFKFKPIYKERIWGGQTLASVYGKDIPAGEKIGESWELADVGDDKSIIANGSLAGKSIVEAIDQFGTAITGNENYIPPFPLLIKILDAQDDLSVQVHPDTQTCLKMGQGNPKTECWYIIDAKPGAVIYKGLKKGTTKEQFTAAIEDNSTAELLNKVEVEVGQCHFLPAGTAHAIGAGLLIAEIQTPSDTTYRVFDWNRLDDSGKSRQLHIEEALQSINFEQDENELTVRNIGRLVDCDYFKIDKGHQSKNCEMLLDKGQMKILIFIDGKGTIFKPDTEKVHFKKGDTILIPASYTGAIRFTEETSYLSVIC